MASKPPGERFWSKVDKTETCWLWTACLNPAGYGQFNRGERGAGLALAHRWAYEEQIGPIPAGLVLDHLCRVRHCVNPAHMEPVTIRENAIERGQGVWANRKRQTECYKGHSLADAYIKKTGTRQCRTCALEHSRGQRTNGPLPVR